MEKMRFNRREFLSALSLGTGFLMFSNPLTSCSSASMSTDPFQLVSLGNSGIKTTLLGMGTGNHANWRESFLTRQDRSQSLGVLRHAYDRGIRFFDCADTYGTHDMVAEALKEIPRDQITLSSKIWFRDGGIPEPERPDANIVVERFLREMKTDYLDLVQIHCMVEGDWTDSYKRQMDIMEDLKSRQLIRAHGVSVHKSEAMQAAIESPWTDVVHARINPYGIAMDQKEPEKVVALLHKLHDAGKGLIGMKLVGNGKLKDDSEKIDNSLRFVLGLGSVNSVIVGFETPDEIDNYIGRMKKTLTEMKEATG